jgi:ABC-type transporter Mla MlaB component
VCKTNYSDVKGVVNESPPQLKYIRHKFALSLKNKGENMEHQVTSSINQEDQPTRLEAERKISKNIMSIRLSHDGLIFKDFESAHSSTSIAEPSNYHYHTERLAGVYCEGIQYFDLSSLTYINNSGMATLIDLLKSLLEMGVDVQFVNVDQKIKQKIQEAGLDKIINCKGKDLEKAVLL